MLKKRPKRPTMDDLNRVRDEAHAWRASFAQSYGKSPDADIRLGKIEERMELVLKTSSSGYRDLAAQIDELEHKINAEIDLRNLNRFDITGQKPQ